MQLRARLPLGGRRIRAVAAVRALSKPAGRSHSTSRVRTDQQGPAAGEAVRTAVSAPASLDYRVLGAGPCMRTGHECCPTPVRTEHPSGARRGPLRPTGSSDPAGDHRPDSGQVGRSPATPGRVRCRVWRDAEGRSRGRSLSGGPSGAGVGRRRYRRASAQLPGQCRSSTDSNVTVSRHTRYGGRAVRAVIDMPLVHHTGDPVDNTPGSGSPRDAGSSIRTRPTGAAAHERLLPRAAWQSPPLRECPDRPAAPR